LETNETPRPKAVYPIPIKKVNDLQKTTLLQKYPPCTYKNSGEFLALINPSEWIHCEG
jgi:hypothetical protein